MPDPLSIAGSAFWAGQTRGQVLALISLCLLKRKKVPMRTENSEGSAVRQPSVRSLQLLPFLTFEALEIRHTYCIYQKLEPKKVAIKIHQIRVQELYFPLGTLLWDLYGSGSRPKPRLSDWTLKRSLIRNSWSLSWMSSWLGCKRITAKYHCHISLLGISYNECESYILHNKRRNARWSVFRRKFNLLLWSESWFHYVRFIKIYVSSDRVSGT